MKFMNRLLWILFAANAVLFAVLAMSGDWWAAAFNAGGAAGCALVALMPPSEV